MKLVCKQSPSSFCHSPYKVKVVPGLGKQAHSKLNDFSLFLTSLYIVFSSFITSCENPGKAAVWSHRGTLIVSLAHTGNGFLIILHKEFPYKRLLLQLSLSQVIPHLKAAVDLLLLPQTLHSLQQSLPLLDVACRSQKSIPF